MRKSVCLFEIDLGSTEMCCWGGDGGARWKPCPEAKDSLLGEQPGSADQGPQAVGEGQRRPEVRTAQAGETTQGNHGKGQGSGVCPKGKT